MLKFFYIGPAVLIFTFIVRPRLFPLFIEVFECNMFLVSVFRRLDFGKIGLD